LNKVKLEFFNNFTRIETLTVKQLRETILGIKNYLPKINHVKRIEIEEKI